REHCRGSGVALLWHHPPRSGDREPGPVHLSRISEMKLCIASLSLLVLAVPAAHAQATPRTISAAEHVDLGDREHTAMNAPAALKHYEAALKIDSMSVDALTKAAREAVDVGEFNPDRTMRDSLFK